MKIEGFRVPPFGQRQRGDLTLIEQRLVQNQAEFDGEIVTALAFLSSWAYAEPKTFAAYLGRFGLPGSQCAVLQLTNEVLLLDNTAYLVQSWDKRSLVLCFRGTQPSNAANWAANATVQFIPFSAGGNVHSGFYRSLMGMWPTLAKLLRRALAGERLCTALEKIDAPDGVKACSDRGSEGPEGSEGAAEPEGEGALASPMLYITGHSLGGALAVLAASLLFTGEAALIENGAPIDFSPYRTSLRGVYTFGQPMVGDPFFAHESEEKFGKKLFRMIYADDAIPHLPPWTMGDYQHFGREYHSTEGGWVHVPGAARPARSLLVTGVVAAFATVIQSFPGLGFQLSKLLGMRDHEPIHYMETSMKTRPLAELLLDFRVTSMIR